MKKSIAIVSLTILASSCASTVIPVPVALQCPDPLVLPKLPENMISEVQVMTPELRGYFIYRDKVQTARRETLQEICRSTQK